MEAATIFWYLVFFAIVFWVASTQAKVRQIKFGWAFLWCLLLGPLFGWLAISLTCKRKEILDGTN